jgi:hypothetical protein
MIVRTIDSNHDWTFGKGRNNYRQNNDAVTQNINTRLYAFINDCFFDKDAGIDWWNLLGSKNKLALELAVSATILNTEGVTGLLALSANLDQNRNITIVYQVVTTYSTNQTLNGTVTVTAGGF